MSSIFKIFSSEDCDFYYDGSYIGHITGNSDKSFQFEVERKGTYRMRFVGSQYKSELRMRLEIGTDEELDVDLDFSEVNAVFIEAEKARERQHRLEAEKRAAEEEAKRKRLEEEKRKAAEAAERLRLEEDRRRREAEDAKARQLLEEERKRRDVEEGKRRRLIEEEERRKAAEEERRVRLVTSLEGGKIIEGFHEGMALIEKNGKWGFIDINGNISCPCIYDELCIDPFLRRGERFKYLDTLSDYLRGPLSFHEGLASVSRHGKYGFIDKNGREVIPCMYDDASYFSDGLACVKLNGKYGFIDRLGREVIPPTYDTAGNFFNGLAPVDHNKIIDKCGRVVFSVKGMYPFTRVHEFSEGLAHFSIHSKYGFIDNTGREVIPCTFDGAHKFAEGMACVKRKYASPNSSAYQYKHGFIDTTGEIVIPCIYEDSGRYFSEGLVSVAKEVRGDYGKYIRWGFVDKTGKEVIPCKYQWVDNFHDGLAMFRSDNSYRGVWGFIDKTGKEVIPPKYVNIKKFSEGWAPFERGGIWGLIDKNGNEIIK